MSNVKGVSELQAKLNKIAFDMDKAIGDAVAMTAFAVESTAVRSIQNESVGKTYKRGTVTHTASKEGDAPNTDTGRLVSSISTKVNRSEQVAWVYTNLDYGEHLEFGTVNMEPRPWLEPAKDANIKKFDRFISKALDMQIVKAGI